MNHGLEYHHLIIQQEAFTIVLTTTGDTMLTKAELLLIRGLLDALARKCQTVGLYTPTREGIKVIDRELNALNIAEGTGQVKE